MPTAKMQQLALKARGTAVPHVLLQEGDRFRLFVRGDAAVSQATYVQLSWNVAPGFAVARIEGTDSRTMFSAEDVVVRLA